MKTTKQGCQVDFLKKYLYKCERLRGLNKTQATKKINRVASCSKLQQEVEQELKEFIADNEKHLLEYFNNSQKEIQSAFDKNKITEEFVLFGLVKELLQADNTSDKINAYKLLGQYLAMWVDKKEIAEVERLENQFSFMNRLSGERADKLEIVT